MNKYKKTIIAAIKGSGPENMCNSWREWLKNLHPELFESEFKVGDWVTVLEKPECWSSEFTDNNPLKAKLKYPYTMRIDKVDNEECISYLANGYGWTNENFEGFWKARKATKEEIETHLIKEAKKRGYKKGETVVTLFYDGTPHTETSKIEGRFQYDTHTDALRFKPKGSEQGDLRIYCKGQWAEIIEETISKEEAEKKLGKKIV